MQLYGYNGFEVGTMKELAFAERLKFLRLEKRLTQEDFARIFHVNKSTVSRWESGQMEPPYETLVQIADYFHVSIDYLLGETDDRHERLKRDLDPCSVDLLQAVDPDNEVLPHIDGEPIDEETARFLYYQLKAIKEKLLQDREKKRVPTRRAVGE